MNPSESRTVLGRSVKLQGEISATEDLLIEGQFTGTIRLPGARLSVGPDAIVKAQVLAQDVLIYGRLEGDLRVAGSVVLRDRAVVLGDVFASRISIEEGAILCGAVDPSRAGEAIPVAHTVPPVSVVPAAPVSAPLQLISTPYPTTAVKPLELFEARPVATAVSGTMPAGLAAAARQFRSPAAHEPEKPFDSPGELAETEA